MSLPSDENLAELEAAVRRRVGFDPRSVGDQSLLRAVCQRMTERRLTNGTDYIAQLLKDEAEFESFVENLVVPETWFFRDRQPFRCVQYYATHRWRSSGIGDRLRILSIPCSTGEEPYSIAMALLDTGLLPSQFQIDAADLSRRALRQAEDAIYGKFSFRGDEAVFPGLCDRFLERQDDQYAIGAELRGTVCFLQANLISPSLPDGRPKYHIVFCRNVLIYLDADARRMALANLHRLLAPEGLLYVGHVEARVAAEGAFGQFNAEFPFAFSPSGQDNRPESVVPAPRIALAPNRPQAVRRKTATAPSTGNGFATARPAPPSDRKLSLRTPTPREVASEGVSVAEKLAASRAAANQGRLDEAAGLCRDVLATDQANVEAFCLLGLVSKVRGEAVEAEAFLQKALFLDPRHEETLIHMMMLAQQRGDESAAANYRRRAEQVQELEG